MANDCLTLLGTKGGPAVRSPDAMPTASLLELGGQTIVIDCGIGVTRAIVSSGRRLLDLDAIFITHLHSDHLLELGPLAHTIWTSGLKRNIQVFGPQGCLEYWRHFLSSMAFDNAMRVEDEGRPPIEELFTVSEYTEGLVCQLESISVSALRVNHPPVTECFALRFEFGDRLIVFSADTAYFPPLAEFSEGANILVHEAMVEEGIELLLKRTANADRLREHLDASHSTAEQAGLIANKAGVGKLVLNHLIPADDSNIGSADFLDEVRRNWRGETIVGSDGMEIMF